MSDFTEILEQCDPRRVKVGRRRTFKDVTSADIIVSFPLERISRTKLFVLRAAVVKNRFGHNRNLNKEECLRLREFIWEYELELDTHDRKRLDMLCGESPQ